MFNQSIKHETQNVKPENCVADLALSLGFWATASNLTEMQGGCFIYSVLKLARLAGVTKEDALRPFDVCQDLARQIWHEIEHERAESKIVISVDAYAQLQRAMTELVSQTYQGEAADAVEQFTEEILKANPWLRS